METVAVTAGASTPTPIVKEVINFIEKYDKNDPTTHEIVRSVTLDKILQKIKTPKPVEKIMP